MHGDGRVCGIMTEDVMVDHIVDNNMTKQEFTDEVFRVFKNKHREISIDPVNTQEAVRFMIGRVEGMDA